MDYGTEPSGHRREIQDRLTDLGWQALAGAKNLQGAVRQREQRPGGARWPNIKSGFEDGGAYE
jgi:hypothetical protein